ncbi:MAG: hypothetical protein M0R06_15965 [Sphaerochaeta sp.]|nr:hypothetical protein [Sphaerochaeta sp.]
MRQDAYDRFHAPENVEWDQAAFRGGYEARERGWSHMRNPGSRMTPLGRYLFYSWQAGWADADAGILADLNCQHCLPVQQYFCGRRGEMVEPLKQCSVCEFRVEHDKGGDE